jgi:hypothetical protein
LQLRHVFPQLGLSLQHFRGRVPVRPFLFGVNRRQARPAKSFAADADSVTNGLSAPLHQIEKVTSGIDDDRARRLARGIRDDLASERRISFRDGSPVVLQPMSPTKTPPAANPAIKARRLGIVGTLDFMRAFTAFRYTGLTQFGALQKPRNAGRLIWPPPILTDYEAVRAACPTSTLDDAAGRPPKVVGRMSRWPPRQRRGHWISVCAPFAKHGHDPSGIATIPGGRNIFEQRPQRPSLRSPFLSWE